ncbi:carbohydrate porin [Roseomonas xinghualingensis]|uniref:carbohydrate porin n=1 Tax=Roseomonas xinghualingensis TaxID=2986475 RepID=UPI0021F1FDBC|nr:carbohydrate porin [Roseomonas sp. SXEYE001]MCV4208177.1 carbohydrate porin [Roseomonas sp. SXEYE001]
MRLRVVAIFSVMLCAAPAGAQDIAAGENTPLCEEGVRIAAGTCLAGELLVDGFANLRGGVRRGVAALVLLELGLNVDLGTVTGIKGWSFGAGIFGIYGRQPTPTLIGSLAPVSSAEALSTLRLSELWLERRFDGVASVRFGQLAADAEFFTAEATEHLTNGTFGWPLGMSTALPSGGPAYPLSAPGIRLELGDPTEEWGLRLAVFSGDPGGRYGIGTDPQRHNRFGTNFSFAGGAFYLAEAAIGARRPVDGQPRPWVLKVGAWRHTGGFDDQRGDPALYTTIASGIRPDPEGPIPRRHGNHGFYTVGEAILWRNGSSKLAVFGRISATPADRNPLSLYADAGFAWREPFGREGDTLSFGVAYARASGEGRALDRALGLPLRDREVVAQLNYEFQVLPDRLYVRPLLQWVSHPNAGAQDDRVTDGRIRDAVTVGVRVRITL